MLPKKFDEVVEYRCNEIKRILCKKSKEYATKTDRMHNFNVAAAVLQKTREEALLGMATKHIVSIFDIVHNVGLGKYPSVEAVEEKIGDAINYFILLEAMLKEDIEV